MAESYGAGRGSARGYAVEIRTTYTEAQLHQSGFLVEREWKRFPVQIVRCDRNDHNNFQSGKIGEIPVYNYCHELDNLNLMNFEAAYALAVQLQTGGLHSICLETRLVEVEVKYSYGATAVAIGQPLSLNKLHGEYRDTKTKVPPATPCADKSTETDGARKS